MYELKIYREVLCHDNEEWYQIWRGIDLSVQNLHEEFDIFWLEYSKISKTCTLIGCFWPKYIMFEVKKYRGVMFDDTEDWCKIWRKTDLCFLKISVYRLQNSDFILGNEMAVLNWKQNLLIYFENCQNIPYSQSKNRLMNTFIIVFP